MCLVDVEGGLVVVDGSLSLLGTLGIVALCNGVLPVELSLDL